MLYDQAWTDYVMTIYQFMAITYTDSNKVLLKFIYSWLFSLADIIT
jgi:hypothetical protein